MEKTARRQTIKAAEAAGHILTFLPHNHLLSRSTVKTLDPTYTHNATQ